MNTEPMDTEPIYTKPIYTKDVLIESRKISLETGRIARQASGAVVVRSGKAVILSTVVRGNADRGTDFLPLTVDYREYFSAAGRIPGGFLRREGRQTDVEVMGSRLCDRSIRPLFPKAYRAQTQVLSSVLSHDPESDPTLLSIIGAAAALHISDIPWSGPVAAIRVGRVEGRLISFPNPEQRTASDMDLVISLSRDGVVMIEGGARQAEDADMLAAIEFGVAQGVPLLDAIESLREEVGRDKVLPDEPPGPGAPAKTLRERAAQPLTEALSHREKMARRDAVASAKAQLIAGLEADHPDQNVGEWAGSVLDQVLQEIMRKAIVSEKRRVDGRPPDGIRPITCEVDWLPSTHGSALFTRGETQAMVTVTMGTNQDRMMVEGLEGIRYERFLLHYQFPAYSVGEARPSRGPGRREIGHGHLARRALLPVLPSEDEFPYTLRVLAEISESNGSSSMATVCGASLALMDGGVPIEAPVAGIAMGLIKEGDRIVVLSDILGDEDHLGDMDFKVAGTRKGVTAIQMDNKIGSLPPEVMASALEQARLGRLHILDEMEKTIARPRAETKPHVPLQTTLSIPTGRVRELIGPGGKVIQGIQAETGAKIEVDNEGLVRIYAPNRDSLDAARGAVLDVAGTMEVGEVYDGVVTGVKEFGAFVRIRGQEGLVHVSQWASHRVEDMMQVAKPGDKVRVKVLEPDRQGRLSLSRKEAL